MKKKHFNKKLQLNKHVVSNLSLIQMTAIKGGTDGYEKKKPHSNECPTPPTSQDPPASSLSNTVIGEDDI